jgi:hypothetical protein
MFLWDLLGQYWDMLFPYLWMVKPGAMLRMEKNKENIHNLATMPQCGKISNHHTCRLHHRQ